MCKLKTSFFILSHNCFLFLFGCNSNPEFSYQILHIEGVTWACNITTSYATFGPMVESGESGNVSLPVSEGDLLYMFNEDDLELYHRFSIENGDRLLLHFDTLITNSAHVNGSLAYLQLSDDPTSMENFMELSSAEVNQLSTLYFPDNITSEMIEVIRLHETSIRGTGIVLANTIEDIALENLLSICQPEWISFNDEVDLSAHINNKFLSGLKLLWITRDIHAFSTMTGSFANLETLIISDWDPSAGEVIPLSNLENLQSLTLADCRITDMSNIEFPSSLKRLHLIGCDTLTNIDAMDHLIHLESLSFTGSDGIVSLESVNNLESMKWISFPANTTQEYFRSILSSHKSLEVIEMIQCPLVSDISILQDQQHLRVLVFNTEEVETEQLANLDQLELIVLNSELFEDDPEKISLLRRQLPQTEIIPGSGLCLGSGWLLLMLPMVLLSRKILRSRTQ